MIGDRSANLRAKFVSGCLAETMLKQEIIPADDGVLNEAVAGLGDLLFLLISGDKFTRVADGDCAGEAIAELYPVEQVLNRHPQLDIIDIAQDEHRFGDPPPNALSAA